jgi:LDH2 family malate/lactate/ureidoglycolate dehydrogenase
MKISLNQANNLSNKILIKLGFSKDDSKLITKNLIEGELAGKKSHGLVRLPAIKRKIDEGKITATKKNIEVIKESPTSLLIDAKNKPGFIAIYKSLELAIQKAKKSNIVVVGIQNASYCSGMIGSYAKEASLKDLIFIGFNNSPGGLVPHGTNKELWGTNPITIGVPTNDKPVILDMASSQITWGDLMVAKQEGKQIKKGVAIDKDGKPTTNPEEAMKGGLLPFFGHKGSGMAFIVELLAGALTGSRVGKSVSGGWGTSYILINPNVFRSLDQFKEDVATSIKELKESSKADGFKEINFPGERSQNQQEESMKNDEIEVSDNLIKTLKEI